MNLHTATIGINETLSIALWNNWQTILNNEMCLQFVVVVLLLSPDLTPLLSLVVQSLSWRRSWTYRHTRRWLIIRPNVYF